MIEDHHRKDQTIRSKNLMKVRGQGSLRRGDSGGVPKKGGVRGGSQKSPNFAHGGGKFGGGVFGGSRKTGGIKHEVL